MSPSYITAFFLFPGADISPLFQQGPKGLFNDTFGPWLDDCLSSHVYLPESDTVTDEVTGDTVKETLFGIHSVEPIHHDDPVIETMRECSWEDVKNALPALYEVAKTQCLPRDQAPLSAEVCFIGYWEPVGSAQWETGWELDYVNFAGEGEIRLKIPRDLA